ncbi:hypothetical protein ACPFUC_003516 [Vibrio cholerae]
MGLDQYWYVKTKNAKKEDKLFFQHRKIPALEKFMADKWNSNSEFNCQRLYINLEILNELKSKCIDKTLDENASGFFWGEHENEHYEEILVAINEAEQLLKQKKYIYYYSWW